MKTILQYTESKELPIRNKNPNLIFLGEATVRLGNGKPVITFVGAKGKKFISIFDPLPSNNLDDIMGVDIKARRSEIDITLIGGSSYTSIRTRPSVVIKNTIILLPQK